MASSIRPLLRLTASLLAAALLVLAAAATADAQTSFTRTAEKRAVKAMRTYFRQAPYKLKRFDYVNAWNCHPVGAGAVDCTVDLAGYAGVYEDVSPYYVCDGLISVRAVPGRPKAPSVTFANASCSRG